MQEQVIVVEGQVEAANTEEVLTGEQIEQEALSNYDAMPEDLDDEQEVDSSMVVYEDATDVCDLSNFFSNVDFSSLLSSIQKLADKNSELTDGEKKFAVDVISEWEEGVIETIRDKRNEANNYIESFNVNLNNIYISDEEFEAVVHATHTEDLYNIYLKLLDDCKELEKDSPCHNYADDPGATIAESIRNRNQHELEIELYNAKVRKANVACANALFNLKKAMNQSELVKEFIRKAGRYSRNIKKFEKECREKGQLAKISVSISNEDVRSALKELIGFSTKI